MKDMFSAIWDYRHFIISSIRNDLRSRFARSRLGALWLILQPLAQVAIYALVLSKVMAAKLPGVQSSYAYVIYLMAGMIAWSLFNEVVTRSMTLFVDSGSLMKKIVFPRVCLPLVVAGSALVNNLLLLLVSAVIFALVGHEPSWAMLWLPVLIMIVLAFSLGLGLILGVLNVFVRDVGQVMNVVLQLLFWLTPIVYMPNIVPSRLHVFLELNPMFHLVGAYQRVILFDAQPSLQGIGVVAVFAAVLLAFSLFLFRRAAPEMVDVL